MYYIDGTYNIWNPVSSERLIQALNGIRDAGVAICGLQEVENPRVRGVIRRWARANGYGIIRSGTPVPILYRPDVFLLRKSEVILFAHADDNPRHPARMAIKANLTHKASGRKIRYFNTHIEHSYVGRVNERARIARLQLTGLAKRADNAVLHNPGMLVRAGGDMNTHVKADTKPWYPGRVFRSSLDYRVTNGLDHIYYNTPVKKLPVIPLTSDTHKLVRCRVNL